MKYLRTDEIPVDQIDVNPHHLRDVTRMKDLDRLKESIRVNGLWQSILVRVRHDGGRQFQLVAGERRFLAHQELGRTAIRADVWEATDDEVADPKLFEQRARVATIGTNVLSEPLELLEQGDGYRKMMFEFGFSESELADLLGVPMDRVQEALHVTRIAAVARKVIEENPDKVTRRHIEALADEVAKGRLSPEAQRRLVMKVVTQEDDKRIGQEPERIKEAAKAARREIREERSAEQQVGIKPERTYTHRDGFIVKSIFECIGDGEDALRRFEQQALPDKIPFVEKREIEV